MFSELTTTIVQALIELLVGALFGPIEQIIGSIFQPSSSIF